MVDIRGLRPTSKMEDYPNLHRKEKSVLQAFAVVHLLCLRRTYEILDIREIGFLRSLHLVVQKLLVHRSDLRYKAQTLHRFMNLSYEFNV